MKPVFLTLLALTTAVVADKTCTPSFDYCANSLIKDKGASPSPIPVPFLVLFWDSFPGFIPG